MIIRDVYRFKLDSRMWGEDFVVCIPWVGSFDQMGEEEQLNITLLLEATMDVGLLQRTNRKGRFNVLVK